MTGSWMPWKTWWKVPTGNRSWWPIGSSTIKNVSSSGWKPADWNAGKIPVALIHPASAGHGLNLQQGGSILVWFGLTWSLELYQQTNARLWRQGQEDKTVIIQHIVAKDTIDEHILKVLEHKDGTQAALIEAVKADLGMTKTGNGGIL